MESVPSTCRLAALLAWSEAAGASDVHARGGEPFVIRETGRLRKVPVELFPAPEDFTLTSWFLDPKSGS